MKPKDLLIDIHKFKGVDKLTEFNFKVEIPEARPIFINLYRNEIKAEELSTILTKVLHGYYINTLGPANLNKLLKSKS